MFNGKKGRIVRHPYLTLTLVGLATVGAVSISEKVKELMNGRMKGMSGVMSGMKKSNINQ